ncbi:hypothetical protein PR048_025223 [Dryococelus australis]|uniref:Transmembrane protein n=1 Tax=Dryococelus australis TaxID=614101 RepID=A0ABQ9GQP4_9NEOP|nr:hypothetical protein PR048_025223 [Dryococelus australis]
MADPSNGWPARFVVMVQLAAWCTVGALLLHMGLASLRPEAAGPGVNAISPATAPATNDTDEEAAEVLAVNATAETSPPAASRNKTSAHYRPSSVLMITVGSTMLVLGPVVLMIREIESRRHYDRFTKPMRLIDVRSSAGMKGWEETGDPRENPLTNGIVRHDSHVRKSGVTRPGLNLDRLGGKRAG